MLVLCLVQQLGADLSTEWPIKLSWLREALLVMDTTDASIAVFVPDVLHELKESMNQIPEDERDSQFTLLHHILNSMLSCLR